MANIAETRKCLLISTSYAKLFTWLFFSARLELKMTPELKRIAVPVIAAIVSFALLLLVRALALGVLRRWAHKTETKVDDIVIHSVSTPSFYWCLAIALYIAIAFSDFPKTYVSYIHKAIEILIVFSVTIALAKLLSRLLSTYVQKTSLPFGTTGLANGIIKGSIYILGFLVILSMLGVSIAPMLTALGVGGLAVALALQDTLANLFAGVHILLEKSIRVGDFVRLENGQEGYIVDITWRTTRIKTLTNNMVVIPNSKLAQSIVLNYHLPEPKMAISIPVGVSYSSDPAKVERVLLEEVKKAIGEVPGLASEPEPVIRFRPGFGESSLDFTVICHVEQYKDQPLVEHELRKRIFNRLKQEGIEIPFPHRTVYLKDERAGQK
jgi:small-conductance mechanosensitive channel